MNQAELDRLVAQIGEEILARVAPAGNRSLTVAAPIGAMCHPYQTRQTLAIAIG